MKTKSGEVITLKEFGHRWKEGIAGITQLQQMKAQIQGTYISILGIIMGIIVNCFYLKSYWWVVLILIGALIVTGVSLIGMKQKYWSLKQMEDILKSIDLPTTNIINQDNINTMEEGKKDEDKL